MRALLCHCHHHLEAKDDDALCAVVREHLIEAPRPGAFRSSGSGDRLDPRLRHRVRRRGVRLGTLPWWVGSPTITRYMAVDVRFAGGQRKLFWPEDLEEIPSPRPWWRSLLGGANVE
jgi:hypothetical protein